MEKREMVATAPVSLRGPSVSVMGWGIGAFVAPSFPIAFTWHLVWFAPTYHALAIYRDDVILPFGVLSMLIQGAAFSYVYPRVFAERRAWLRNGLWYGLALALLSWSFTTLAVAAKNVMTSVPTYLLLETGFTLVQFAVVGPLIAFVFRRT